MELADWIIRRCATGWYGAVPLAPMELANWLIRRFATGSYGGGRLDHTALRHWLIWSWPTGWYGAVPLARVELANWMVRRCATGWKDSDVSKKYTTLMFKGSDILRWKHYVPFKRWITITEWRSVTSQKSGILQNNVDPVRSFIQTKSEYGPTCCFQNRRKAKRKAMAY